MNYMKKEYGKKNLIDINNLKGDLFLVENSFGRVHELDCREDENGEKEYRYIGRLHNGKTSLISGVKLLNVIPTAGYDHGYTLEGVAKNIFEVENGLSIYNASEKRTFNYINANSTLNFVGDKDKTYEIYIKIYDKCGNNRWVVIAAKERLD